MEEHTKAVGRTAPDSVSGAQRHADIPFQRTFLLLRALNVALELLYSQGFSVQNTRSLERTGEDFA